MSLTPINLDNPLYNENKQRQKDWTDAEQIKIIRYLSKDFIQPRPGKSFKKNIIVRSCLGRNILADMHPMVELHTTLVYRFPVRAQSLYSWCRACPTYGLCRACPAQSKICAKCVYAMNVCAMRYKIGVLLGQT